jgi:hypothetical protein
MNVKEPVDLVEREMTGGAGSSQDELFEQPDLFVEGMIGELSIRVEFRHWAPLPDRGPSLR